VRPTLSIISPVYLGLHSVGSLVSRLESVLKANRCTYEIILVEDGSPDESWREIEKACATSPHVRGIRLSRNFGQHHAITAGLHAATGKWVTVMDCDLQDRPEEIPKLLAVAERGYDVVYARRANRQDSLAKRAGSWCFYRTLSFLTGEKHDPTVANFGVYSRRAIEAVRRLPESTRYFPSLVRWVGFSSVAVDVEHSERESGSSSYSLRRLVRLATDVILNNSDRPLRLVVKAGFAISLASFCFALLVIYRAIRGEYSVLGYASIMASIWLLGGLVIFILGLVGLYIGKVFEAAKNRPAYIVMESLNFPQ